jgi:hypothetical protein
MEHSVGFGADSWTVPAVVFDSEGFADRRQSIRTFCEVYLIFINKIKECIGACYRMSASPYVFG